MLIQTRKFDQDKRTKRSSSLIQNILLNAKSVLMTLVKLIILIHPSTRSRLKRGSEAKLHLLPFALTDGRVTFYFKGGDIYE